MESPNALSSPGSPKATQALLIHIEDDVAVALEAIVPGTEVTVAGGTAKLHLRARGTIPFAHKMAVRPITKGETILKYGAPVAVATTDIAIGDWVHTHNARSAFEEQKERSES